jgi:Uma2 family endonuclease
VTLATQPPYRRPSRDFWSQLKDSVYRLTVDQYHHMIAAGVFTSDDKLELLDGLLVAKMPQNTSHATVVGTLDDLLRPLAAGAFVVRSQVPVTLADSEPEPDLVLARGRRADYADHHPTPEDVGLLIEVADTSLAHDRDVKASMYAEAGVSEFWIVNIVAHQVEIYRDPEVSSAKYRDVQIVDRYGRIAWVMDGRDYELSNESIFSPRT